MLDYLPRQSLVLIDDLQSIQDAANEIEEQALVLRQESIREQIIPEDFQVPYLSWQELQDTITLRPYLELGQPSNLTLEHDLSPGNALPEGAPPNGEQAGSPPILETRLSCRFEPGPRFGGRLKPVMEYIQERREAGDLVVVVSRQKARLQSLWNEQVLPGQSASPLFVEGSLGEGWIFSPRDVLACTCSPMARFLAGADLNRAVAPGRWLKRPNRITATCRPRILSCMSIMASAASWGWCSAQWTGSSANTCAWNTPMKPSSSSRSTRLTA